MVWLFFPLSELIDVAFIHRLAALLEDLLAQKNVAATFLIVKFAAKFSLRCCNELYQVWNGIDP